MNLPAALLPAACMITSFLWTVNFWCSIFVCVVFTHEFLIHVYQLTRCKSKEGFNINSSYICFVGSWSHPVCSFSQRKGLIAMHGKSHNLFLMSKLYIMRFGVMGLCIAWYKMLLFHAQTIVRALSKPPKYEYIAKIIRISGMTFYHIPFVWNPD